MTTTKETLTTTPTAKLQERADHLRRLSADYPQPVSVAMRRRACELEFIAYIRDLRSVSHSDTAGLSAPRPRHAA